MRALTQRWEEVFLHLGVISVFLAVWYLLHLGLPTGVPLPPKVVRAFIEQVLHEDLPMIILNSIAIILFGFSLSALIGIPAGIIVGSNKFIDQLINPYVTALFAAPFSALVIAFVFWFGSGVVLRIWSIVFLSVFYIIINTSEGIKSVPPDLVEVAESFDASRLYVIRNVVIPHEIPYILAGLRMGLTHAIKALVAVEILVAVTGLGGILTSWSRTYRMEGVFSIVIVLMLMGILGHYLVRGIEKKLVTWPVGDE